MPDSKLSFSEDALFPTENEKRIVDETAVRLDLSHMAVVRRFIRLGQMTDHFIAQGYEIVFRKGEEEVDPFDRGPKLAPMPTCSACEKSQRREWTEPEEHTCGLEQHAAWENEGGA